MLPMLRPLSVFLLSCFFLYGCAVNPVTGRNEMAIIPESSEINIGAENYAPSRQMQGGDYIVDPQVAAYVNEVGQRLARASHRPELEYHFTVLDSPTVNAFALPGGYVYITRGIMAYLDSEAEMAAVLGHEIGHVTARHSVRRHSASTATGVAGAVVGAATGIPGSQDLFNTLGNAMISADYRL